MYTLYMHIIVYHTLYSRYFAKNVVTCHCALVLGNLVTATIWDFVLLCTATMYIVYIYHYIIVTKHVSIIAITFL